MPCDDEPPLDPSSPLPGILDTGRLEALRATNLLDSDAEESFDRFTHLAKLSLGIPVALVSLVDDRRQFFKSQVGLPSPWAELRETPLSHSFCQRVVSTKAPLIVTNALTDDRVKTNPAVSDLGVQAYAGLPLTTSDGHTLGAFCVVSPSPREWTDAELQTLERLAAGVLTEIELRQKVRELSERRAIEQAVFAHAGIGLVVTSSEGRIVRANRHLGAILGYADDELSGESIFSLVHPEDLARNKEKGEALVTGDVDRISDELRFRTRSGRYVWVRASLSSARDAHGRIEHMVATLEEIEEARRTKEALRASEDRYRALVKHLPNTGIMMFDHNIRCLIADGEQLFQSVGVAPQELIGRYIPDMTVPHNRAVMIQTYRETLAGKRESVEIERNGRQIVVHTTPVRDSEGVITGGMVMLYDITVQKQAENALRAQSEAMKLVEDVATAANQSRTSNEAFQRVLERVATHMGWPVGHAFIREGDELVPTDVWYLRDPEVMKPFVDATRTTRFARGVALGRIIDRARAMWMLDIGETDAYVRRAAAAEVGLSTALAFPVLVGTEVVGVLEFDHTSRVVPDEDVMILMANIGMQLGRVVERERYAAEVRTLSLRDELTGLLNRRGFMDLGQRQHEIARDTKRPFTLIFADLNGMKPINDQLGHAAGDGALRDTADILRKAFRDVDLVARLGGDEFVVLADGADASHTERLERRVRDAIALFNASATRPFRISLSLGVAHFDPANPRPLGVLLAEADGGMYAQKRARRANPTLSLAPVFATRSF